MGFYLFIRIVRILLCNSFLNLYHIKEVRKLSNIKDTLKKYAKIYAVVLILIFIFDSIGELNFKVGAQGAVVIIPMVFATLIAGLLGPDVLKFFNKEESDLGGTFMMITLLPFMAKMGVSAGANLPELISIGPALILNEFGNIFTIFFALPVALLMGLKKESIGATYSINRNSNLGLTTDIYGPDAPETKGTFGVYIAGSVIGTIYISIMVGIIASWDLFHPYALGIASGIGSGVMMSASAGTLGAIYPEYAEQMLILGGTSDMLTGVTGLYMGLFIALPLTKKLYEILEPKIGNIFVKKKGDDVIG